MSSKSDDSSKLLLLPSPGGEEALSDRDEEGNQGAQWKWGPSHTEYIVPFTDESKTTKGRKVKKEFEKANAPFLITIDNYKDLWSSEQLQKVQLTPEDSKIHSTHTV